jgi:carbonic anhydrase
VAVPGGEDGTGHRRMLDQLKQNNRVWAEGKLAVDPVFFKLLEAQQRPEYLCVAAAVDGKRRGLSDHWLHPIREVTHDHQAELKSDEMSLAWSRFSFGASEHIVLIRYFR